MPAQPPTQVPVTRAQVIEICGPLDDMRIAGIIATGATEAEVMEARTWLGSDDYLSARMHRAPAGRVGQLVDLLKADEPDWEER